MPLPQCPPLLIRLNWMDGLQGCACDRLQLGGWGRCRCDGQAEGPEKPASTGALTRTGRLRQWKRSRSRMRLRLTEASANAALTSRQSAKSSLGSVILAQTLSSRLCPCGQISSINCALGLVGQAFNPTAEFRNGGFLGHCGSALAVCQANTGLAGNSPLTTRCLCRPASHRHRQGECGRCLRTPALWWLMLNPYHCHFRFLCAKDGIGLLSLAYSPCRGNQALALDGRG